MKVLVISSGYPTRTAPARCIFVHRQVRAMADLGARCVVVQPTAWSPPPPMHRLRSEWCRARVAEESLFDDVDGIPVEHPRYVLPVPSRFFPGDTWTRIGAATASFIARRPDLRDADVLYGQFLCDDGYVGLLASEATGIPLVAIARGDDVHLWPRRWPDRVDKVRRVMAGADAVLAVSPSLARDAEALAGAPPFRPFQVVPNGVDTMRFHPAKEGERADARRRLGLPVEGRLFLCVATGIVVKGWRDLLDAWTAAEGARAGWSLLGVGRGRPGDGVLDLPAEAASRDITGDFLHREEFAPEVMPDLYRACDAFVLASHDEGLSNALMEALASGLPTVATRVGGHADAVRDGEEALLVPPRDVPALTGALRSVMTNPALASRLARSAPEAAARLGTPTENTRRLLCILEEAAASGRARRRA